MESLASLVNRKKEAVQNLKHEVNGADIVLQKYIREELGFSSDSIRSCHMDNDRVVIVANHKAYASILAAHSLILLEKMHEKGLQVSSITVL